MRDERPSFTAQWVALCRGLSACLPREARLSVDPYGLAFSGPLVQRLGAIAPFVPPLRAIVLAPKGPFFRLMLWLQMRTRVLDDALVSFAARGGRQVVILGAGFDCRAQRFSLQLGDSIVFEVDHPATQRKKRGVLDALEANTRSVRFLPWDFEARPLAELPDALAALGHDRRAPTLVLWEGVTMYLSEEVIDASFAAIASFAAPGSQLVFNYVERASLARPDEVQRFVAKAGEPYRFGWDPAALPAFVEARGFVLESDRDDDALAAAFFAPELARSAGGKRRRIAVVRRV